MGAKKSGANKKKCKQYRDENRLEKNKKRKAETLKRHLEKCKARKLLKEAEENA